MLTHKTQKSALTKAQKKAIMNGRPSRTIAEIDQERMYDSTGGLRHERVHHAFTWLPLHERPSQYHWLPKPHFPIKETRKPHFWLSGGQSCWFINDSEDTLDYVGSLSGLIATSDDEPITITSNRFRYYYEQVQPHEAVLVESLDTIFDSDFLVQVDIELKSPTYGTLQLRSNIDKGTVAESLFIWNTGEYVNHATIQQIATT